MSHHDDELHDDLVTRDPYDNTTIEEGAPGVVFHVDGLHMRVLFGAIGGLGVLSNLLVIVVMVARRRTMLRGNTNIFIINQSLMDLLAGVFLILIKAVYSQPDARQFVSFWDRVYCHVWLTQIPLWWFLVSSTYNLMALTIDRYLAIVHPFWHRSHCGRRSLTAALVFSWSSGLLMNILTNLPHGIIRERCALFAFWPSPEIAMATGVLLAIIQFFLPLIIHGYCYIRIILVLTGKVGKGETTITTTSVKREDDKKERARKNIVQTLAIVTGCYCLCWVCNQCLWFAFNIGFPVIDFRSAFYNFSVIAVFVNCCVNPFVYLTTYRQFQHALASLVCGNQVKYQDGKDGKSRVTASTMADSDSVSVGAGSMGAGSMGAGSVGAGSMGAGSMGAGSVGVGSVSTIVT